MKNGSIGGSAAAGGMEYQHRVAAWAAVRILAEKDADTPWDLGSKTTFEWLKCETEQPVDDLLIGTSSQGFVFSQIKHTLRLSEDAQSELASALDQFIRQFITCQNGTSGLRPLDAERDRLILITSQSSSKPIRVHLHEVLNRARNLPNGHNLKKAALNDQERRALLISQDHITRLWQKIVGKNPSENEIRQLLALISIETLDVDQGNIDERETKNLLRIAILRDPDQADLAWTRLVALCSGFATQRAGADRTGLQQALIQAGLKLKAARSYQSDIKQLREYSQTNVQALAQHSRIRVGLSQVKIKRPCTAALKQAAEKKSLIIVGEPGAGKSGALHDVLETLEAGERDYVFLPVDRLASQSLGELRGEIGLEHELINVLDNWPGVLPAFLIIDALDAARGDRAGKMIRDLIRTVIEKANRWHVVASIRKFDLRYSTELPQLFAGVPPTDFHDEEFRNVHHLNIPRLSDNELEQVASQSSELQVLVNLAREELRDLIRVPFNLRLLAELLGFGISPRQLVPIRTQIDLLERYWMQRVIREDGLGDAREATLRRVSENMVRARELRANRLDVVEMGNSPYLDDLLSAQVLVEWKSSSEALPDRYVLAFSHHVLFDYAVSRLLLRGTHEAIVKWFEDDIELIIVVRPSILFQFQQLWTLDQSHKLFWNLIFRFIQSSEIPVIGKLIGPSVAASLATTGSDLEILTFALEEVERENSTVAENAFQNLVGALLVEAQSGRSLIEPNAGPWCELLERVSRSLNLTLAYTIRPLIFTICEHPENLSDGQRNYVGKAARRLSEFAWTQSRRDSGLIIHALQCVCRTYESDPILSAQLIRRCLEPSRLAQYGFEEIPQLAGEIIRLIYLDSALVGDFYRAAFANLETSDERTSIGGSRIMPLSSTRKQDYKMAFYELGNMFQQFLEGAEEDATRTLIAVIASYVMQKHSLKSETLVENTFDVNGIQGRLCTDYSSIWDGSGHHTDDQIKMLNTLQGYLESLAIRTQDPAKLNKLIRIIITENRFGVFWRRLLLSGAQFPNTIGMEIIPLAWAIPILIDYDTSVPAGMFIRAIFPILSPNERERIELAILSIPNTASPDQRESFEHKRDRLLGSLIDFELTTNEARNILRDLKAKDAIPPNELSSGFSGLTSRPYGEKEYLEEHGVPVDADPSRNIRTLADPVNQFATKHLNVIPNQEEFEDIIPTIRRLHEALLSADQDGVHPMQQDYGWGHLIAACNRLVRAEDWNCEDEVGELIRELLLRASQHSNPLPDPEHDGQFDEFPSWGSPSPRIEAAEGLITIARKNICANLEVLSAIHRLVTDPVPAVRYQIATRLYTLYDTQQQTSMWQIIEQICEREVSRGVLHGLLNGPLNRLAGVDPDRVAGLTKIIFDRVQTGKGAESVRDSCMSIFVGLYIWRDTKLCAEIAMEVASSPSVNLKEAGKLLSHLREPLTHGPIDPSEPDEDAVRKRAISLLSKLLLSARKEIRQIEESYSGSSFHDWSSEDIEHAQSLGQLINRAGTEIYFASGAYNNQRQGNDRENLLTRPQMDRFYYETSAILDELATSGFASVTYHLIETLEAFIPLDPRGVFLRIHSVIRAGKDGGYQYEGLAANLMVKILERYLAEYRALLQEDSECRRSLIEILDTFVQAGWPSARRLTYKLDEIFR